MIGIINIALESFKATRKISEKRAAVLEKEISQLEKDLANKLDWWQFSKRYQNRKAKKKLKSKASEFNLRKEQIKKYLEAEQGIKLENYEPAISALDEMLRNLLKQSTTVNEISISYDAIGILKLKYSLMKLQKQKMLIYN